jgi:hypothetical protein
VEHFVEQTGDGLRVQSAGARSAHLVSLDNFSIMLVRDAFSQLIYKNAILTIVPAAPIRLLDEAAKAPSDRDRRPM